MSDIELRNVNQQDFPRIVALNQAEIVHTSKMDKHDLARLHGISAYHKVILVNGHIAGFLLVMGPKSQYINENYIWFKKQYAQYMYIDRIVLDVDYQGKQLGRILYEDLFSFSKQHGVNHVVCEYNVLPPNLSSAKFHQRLGFVEVGFQWLPLNKGGAAIKGKNQPVSANTHKKVSMQCCDLSVI